MTIKSRHGIKDPIAQRIIWCFWTGMNPMSEQRRRCFESMAASTECSITLITPENLAEFISPDHPLHPGYEALSPTHRSDYLRTYFLYVYGGGYSDIKMQTGSWLASFEALEAHPEMFGIGYKEYSYGVPAHLMTASGIPLSHYWELLIGNGAYIFRGGTGFTKEWFAGLHQVMDKKLDVLVQYIARFPHDTTGAVHDEYPVSWSEVLGDIFHPICFKYFNRLMNTLPPPRFIDYR